MRVRCIYSTLTCSFSRLLASLTNTDRHWSNSYAVLSLKRGDQLTLRCNSASTTLSKLQYFPQFPVLRHQIIWILHFSLLCRPGEFGHNEKSKRKMKTDKAIFFQACLLCLKATVHEMTDWLQLLHPEVWRTPRDRRWADDRDLLVSSEWVKAIVASQ